MYVCAINGSPNTDGNTVYLLNRVLEKLDGIETEIIHFAKEIENLKRPFCTCCSTPCNKSCFSGTGVEEAFEKMVRADVILFGSPVYFGGPTAQIKALFDKSRAYRSEKLFVGKYGAAVVCGASKYGGQEATVNSLQNSMLVQGMTIIGPGSHAYDAGHLGVCASKPAIEDAFANSRCDSLAARIMEILK